MVSTSWMFKVSKSHIGYIITRKAGDIYKQEVDCALQEWQAEKLSN